MYMKIFCTAHIVLLVSALAVTGCSPEENVSVSECENINIIMNVKPFVGEQNTRTALEGGAFDSGDKIRFKIICPYVSSHELGETWGSFYTLTVSDKVANNNVSVWSPGDTYGSYEAQSTTYVYSAQNTTDTRYYVVGNELYGRPSTFFHADQSKQVDFKASDLVWAQAFRQTGAREVHFNFMHKVAKLDVTIDDSMLEATEKVSGNAILTLEGMPDIDGAEIVVGDYYADESYESDYKFNYKEKASCQYEYNGKVLGIEVVDDAAERSKIWPMSGNPANPGGANSSVYQPDGTNATPVPNTGTYTAYKYASKRYWLYVPACELTENAVFWLRDGSRRYRMILANKKFEEGVCYTMTLAMGDFAPSAADKSSWEIVALGGDQLDNYEAAKAIDSNPDTYWFSNKSSFPHVLMIDMQKDYSMTAFVYTTTRDISTTYAKDYEIFVSENASDYNNYKPGVGSAIISLENEAAVLSEPGQWTHVKSGSFTYGSSSASVDNTVTFDRPTYGRYLMFVVKSIVSSNATGVSAGEIGIKAIGVKSASNE